MDTINQATPAEAIARARALIAQHRAILDQLDGHPGTEAFNPVQALVLTMMDAQITAAEAIVAAAPDCAPAFRAGHTVGSIAQALSSATETMAALVPHDAAPEPPEPSETP